MEIVKEETLSSWASEPLEEARAVRGLLSTFAARPCLLGLLLLSPSLALGFLLDDYVFLGMIRGFIPVSNGWTGLYEFFFHSFDANQALIRDNFLPWWIDPHIEIRFFRPLSSILLRLDHECFGEQAFFYHLHSLAWYVLAITAASMLYRRCFRGSILTLALLLFAIDDAHAMPAGWIANRNAYVAAVPSWFGLVAYLSYRERGFRPGLWLSVLCDAVGLMGGEIALCVLPYAFCYELFGARDRWTRRLCALLPKLLLFVAYFAVYRGLGQGAHGSDFYLDPIQQAGPFLRDLPSRLGALLSGTFAGLLSELWLLMPQSRPLLAGIGLVACIGVLWAVFRRRPTSDDDPVRHLRWLSVGAVVSLLPSAATIPSNRLVAPAMLAIAPCIAFVWTELREGLERRNGFRRLAMKSLLFALFGMHAVLAPLGILATLGGTLRMKRGSEQSLRQLQEIVPGGQERHVVVINAPDLLLSSTLPMMYALRSGRTLASFSVLTMARVDLEVETEEPRCLVISAEEPLLSSLFEVLFRSVDTPFTEGDCVATDLFSASIRRAEGDGARQIAFEFSRPLTDPSLLILYWNGIELERFPVQTSGRFAIPFALGPAGF